MYRVAGRGKPPQLRSLTPRTPPVQPEPTPQGRRHWCRLTEKYCTRIAPPFQKVPLSPRNLPLPFSPSSSSSRLSLSLLFHPFFLFSNFTPNFYLHVRREREVWTRRMNFGRSIDPKTWRRASIRKGVDRKFNN